MKTLNKLTHYMGNRKKLFPVAIILSAVSELAGIAPYILIWLIMRELLAGSPVQANGNIAAYALWTGIAAVGSVALYFASLACSHLVAFRVETNIRSASSTPQRAAAYARSSTTTPE
jgi:ATP-binding cassette subfamily B protein IrtA